MKYFEISGAGTILGQGGQERERQSRERDIKFFAEIEVFLSQNKRSLKKNVFAGFGVSLCLKNKRSLKKKGLRRIWSVFMSQKQASLKKSFLRIRSVFSSQKWPRIQVSGGPKFAQRG